MKLDTWWRSAGRRCDGAVTLLDAGVLVYVCVCETVGDGG